MLYIFEKFVGRSKESITMTTDKSHTLTMAEHNRRSQIH